MSAKERRAEFPRFDRKLRKAASEDMAAYVGEVMSSIAFRGGRGGVHSIREKDILSCEGWTTVRFPYRRTKGEKLDVFAAFGVRRNMTPGASETVSRLGVGLGSFGETSEVLAMLACGRVSESKIRSETLAVGEDALAGQRNPGKDVRDYTDAQLHTPEDAKRVPRTLAVMADGTNPPCTKADTQGVRGKDGGDAKSRQLRVVSACEYANVTAKGAPIPIRGSFSYAVTDKGIGELTSLIHEHAVSRGSGTVPRVQCVADGEGALEKAMRDALPFAVFTNDIMHALQYLSLCCENLGIPDWRKEYATSRRIMFRHGGGSVADRIKRLYGSELEASEAARDAIDYIDRRRDNMRYGWLRENGYYISSAHAEAAARILVARRCKQAGMHWRHHNAACVCALIAKIRSAA